MPIRKFFKAFYYAGRGIVAATSERNVRFHLAAMVGVLGLGWYVQLERMEWIVVLVLIAMVLSAEMVNTAVEDLANHLRDDLHIGYSATTRARDVAAGAVLVIALVAAVIGVMVFWPKLF